METQSLRRVPLWRNIILSIFICSLALHFFTETLSLAAPVTAMDLLERGDHDNSAQVDVDDDLVNPIAFTTDTPQPFLRIASLDTDNLLSAIATPVPPPPKAS